MCLYVHICTYVIYICKKTSLFFSSFFSIILKVLLYKYVYIHIKMCFLNFVIFSHNCMFCTFSCYQYTSHFYSCGYFFILVIIFVSLVHCVDVFSSCWCSFIMFFQRINTAGKSHVRKIYPLIEACSSQSSTTG